MRNLDSKGLRELCSCEGTTGAHEVTTIDELHRPVLLGGEGGGTLTSKCPVKTRHIHLQASVPVLPVGQAQYQNLPKFITTVVVLPLL